MRRALENRHERLALVEDAGMGRLSGTSVLAGVLVSYGAFAVLAGVTAAVLGAMDINVDLGGEAIGPVGAVSAAVLGIVLLASYLFGGYTAGRMARRAGLTHGLVVFAASLLLAIAAAAVVEVTGATREMVDFLRQLGVPGSGEQWRELGAVAGVASLAGMLLGSLVGGVLGERWHSKLMARALDPDVGPEAAAARSQAKAARAARRRRDARSEEHDGDEVVVTDTRRERTADPGRGSVVVAAGSPGEGSRSGASTATEHPRVTETGSGDGESTATTTEVDPKESSSVP